MSSTPKSVGEESLSESWMDVTLPSGRVTPVALQTVGFLNGGSPISVSSGGQMQLSSQLISEEDLKLLKEAQREGNYAVSLASSRRDSRCESPKSPPNSPNNEVNNPEEEFKDIFINKNDDPVKDWVMPYWLSKCDGSLRKSIKGKKPKASLSLRHKKCGEKGLFSRDVMFTFFLSNLLSLLVGAGIGLYVSKRPTTLLTQFK